MIKIGVTGYNGRMGRVITEQVMADKSVELSHAYCRIGPDAPNFTDDVATLFADSNVVIDFTKPEAMKTHLPMARQYQVPMVIGSTGLSAEHKALFNEYARDVPIVYAPNMSVGINIMLSLIEKAAALHGESYDVEISELHHRHKADAPSGTAIALGESVQKGRGLAVDSSGFKCRTAAHIPGEIGFAVMRGGEVTGDHSVHFIGDEEIMTITHRALNTKMYATGAIKAAKWITGKEPGLYNMRDVLGI